MGREPGSNGDKTGSNGNETGNDVKESYRGTQREEKGRAWEAGGNGNMEGREERGGVSVKGGRKEPKETAEKKERYTCRHLIFNRLN